MRLGFGSVDLPILADPYSGRQNVADPDSGRQNVADPDSGRQNVADPDSGRQNVADPTGILSTAVTRTIWGAHICSTQKSWDFLILYKYLKFRVVYFSELMRINIFDDLGHK